MYRLENIREKSVENSSKPEECINPSTPKTPSPWWQNEPDCMISSQKIILKVECHLALACKSQIPRKC